MNLSYSLHYLFKQLKQQMY